MYWAFVILMALFLALALRTAWIQIVRADEYKEKAIAQQTSDLPIEAKRGSILDRNGNELATSAATYSVWVRPTDIKKNYKSKEIEELSGKLAVILGLDQETVKKKMTEDSNLVSLAKSVDKETVDRVRALKISGLATNEGTKRYYPLGTSAANVLGCVNSSNNGVAGIEQEYDSYLRGIDGRQIQETDINGNSLSYGSNTLHKAKDGYNVVLTIDEVLQHYAEKAAEEAMAKYNPSSVQILVMNPKTGDLLAMAKTPTYDPNDPYEPADKTEQAAFKKLSTKKQSEYLSQMWNNPMVSNLYEPGSTFKLITAASALESGKITTKTTFNCTGSINVSGTRLYCFNYEVHGQQDLAKAVANSCNTAHVRMVMKLGSKQFYNYLNLWGITSKTGIDLPAEADAIIKNRNSLSLVDLATMGYGQGIALTPIQLLTAISAIGNNGILMQPRVVSKMTDSNGKTVKTFHTKKVRQVISKKTADEMLDIMEYEVTNGGGYTAAIDGYRIGGKTGTANKAINGTYSDDSFCSFVCLAPLDDPQLAVLVILDTPKKGGSTGSSVGGPTAKAFLKDAFTYLGISPKYTESEKENQAASKVSVPSVTGLSKEAAIEKIEAAGFEYEVSPSSAKDENFTVKSQYPEAGETLSEGATVYIYK